MSTSVVEELFPGLALASSERSAEMGGEQEDSPRKGIISGEGPLVPEGEIDETTCAICLNKIPLPESAQPENCDHLYCACCILHWAVYKEKPWCPQCKAPFSSLLTFRALDGDLRDFPSRESVCLLKRAGWFQEHVKEGSIIDESDYGDYARYYDEYDDDEEVENYYFSAAAGRARVVLGNRRHGPNGFISSGRMQARPAPTPPPCKGKKPKEGEGASSASVPASARKQPGKTQSSQSAQNNKKAGRNSGSGDFDLDFPSPGANSSSGKQSAGRRARRNQRRAAADAKAGF